MRFSYVFVLTLVVILADMSVAWAVEMRTANRPVYGRAVELFNPMPTKHLGENYRSWGSAHSHTRQHEGTDWDVSKWNEKLWTSEKAIERFYAAHVLHRQYIKGDYAVVEVGPSFYDLAFSDQQRVMALLAEQHGFFESGLDSFQIRDWHNHKLIGRYGRGGLSLVQRGPVVRKRVR